MILIFFFQLKENELIDYATFVLTLGFLGDKLGNYKILTISGVILGGTGPFGVLWLFNDHQHYKALQYNITGQNWTSDNSLPTMTPDVQQAHTFPLLVLFSLLNLYSGMSTFNLLDAYALTVCKKHGGDFGRQKLWGNCRLTYICNLNSFLNFVIHR